jgi:hypothetical protein
MSARANENYFIYILNNILNFNFPPYRSTYAVIENLFNDYTGIEQ